MAVDYVVLSASEVLDQFGAEKLIHFSRRTQQVQGLSAMLESRGVTGDEALDKEITLKEYVDDEVKVTTHSLRSMMAELAPFEAAAKECPVYSKREEDNSLWGTLHFPESAALEQFFVNSMQRAADSGEHNEFLALVQGMSGETHAAMRRYGRDDDKPRPQTELEQALTWEWQGNTLSTDQLFEVLFFQERLAVDYITHIAKLIGVLREGLATSEMNPREVEDIEQYLRCIERAQREGVDIFFAY